MSEHRRQVKRYTAALRKHGICRACIHRQCTDGRWHCRNDTGKSHGACLQSESSYPRFEVVGDVLEEFADAA